MQTQTLPNGTILKGKYRVLRLVGGGGMAFVYEVEEQRPDGSKQSWALKELRADTNDLKALEEGRQLFEQEANILVRLSHPNLPSVSAFFEEQGRSYLVMEFIRGDSLEKRLERANAPMLESQVLDWAVQICEVLTYLHTQPTPIIFRDMKPSNVMVTLDERVKLIDFGIARTYKVGKRKDTVTMGSENYAAPEQWGKAQTDPRADIYALGATMYHLLTNVPPLPAFVPTPRVSIQQYNPAVTDRTVAVVERALAQNRDARFPSAHAMQQALLECASRQERRRIEERLQQVRAAANAPTASQPRQQPQAASQPQTAMPLQPVAQSQAATPTQVTPRPATSRPSQAQTTPGSGPAQQAATITAPQGKLCPQCRTWGRPEARFCGQCGYVFVPPLPPVLAILEPKGARWELPLRDHMTLIGRQGGMQPVDLDLDFYDPEGFVSRNHARIVSNQRRFHIIDLDSGNGTIVNGQSLQPRVPYPLRHGDLIRLGKIVLQFKIR